MASPCSSSSSPARPFAKPLYLDGDLRRSFISKGGADFKCSEDEMRRFLRDASTERHDSGLLEDDATACFDPDTLRWYRGEFARQRTGEATDSSDLDFLARWGLIREQDCRRLRSPPGTGDKPPECPAG